MIFNLKKLCYNIGKEATVKQEESFGEKSMERIGIAGNIRKALFKNVYFISRMKKKEHAFENYRACLREVNSDERYREYE